MKSRTVTGLTAGALGLGLLGVPAAHAAVPVNLRIEGPRSTVFEGRLNVPERAFSFTGEQARHPCDGTAALGGRSARPVATRGAALAEAADRFGFAIKGTWNDAFGATFTKVGGQRVSFDARTNRFLAEYHDGAFAQLGACADPVRAGDDVLFAYGDGSEPLLALRGAKRVSPSTPVTVRVADAGGAPVAGAKVGGATTGADGAATLGRLGRGYHDLKATKPGAIRSNRLSVCVSNRKDGACAPRVEITDIRGGERFRRSAAPKRLRGVVEAAPFGIRSIALRVHRPGANGTAYTVKRHLDWSRSLRSRLARGRWVLEAVVTDRRGISGHDRVKFRVA